MEGIPLLAIMDRGDIVADIESGAGKAFRNGESELLAREIQALRDDPQRVCAMQEHCRKLYLQKYTPEVCLPKYQALFRELLGTGGGA